MAQTVAGRGEDMKPTKKEMQELKEGLIKSKGKIKGLLYYFRIWVWWKLDNEETTK